MAQKTWKGLAPMSQDIKVLNHFVSYKGNEFLIAPSRRNIKEKLMGIFKYNSIQDKFELFYELNKDQFFSGNSMCYDSKNDKLYIFHRLPTYITIDIRTKQLSTHKLPLNENEHIGNGGRCVCTALGEAHLIGGTQNGYHYISKGDKVIQQNKFPDNLYLYAPGFVYLQSKGSVITIGGINRCTLNNNHVIDAMYEYVISNHEWKKMECKLPKPMALFASVVTKDEKYVITIGGKALRPNSGMFRLVAHNKIMLFSVDDYKWYQSEIGLPRNDTNYRAAIICDTESDKKLIYGYLRNENTLIDLGQDIVELIFKWYSMEMLHVVSCSGGSKQHFCICVDDILDNMTPYFTL